VVRRRKDAAFILERFRRPDGYRERASEATGIPHFDRGDVTVRLAVAAEGPPREPSPSPCTAGGILDDDRLTARRARRDDLVSLNVRLFIESKRQIRLEDEEKGIAVPAPDLSFPVCASSAWYHDFHVAS